MLDDCVLLDLPSRAGRSVRWLHMRSCAIADFAAGGEIVNSAMSVSASHFAQFPDTRAQYEDTDADGLYIVGGEVNVTHSVFRDAKDDCIDSGTGEGVRSRRIYYMAIKN